MSYLHPILTFYHFLDKFRTAPTRNRSKSSERQPQSIVTLIAMNQLSLFTKYPVAGAAKTRLIPKVGAQGAADIHRALTEHTLQTVSSLKRQIPVDIEITYTESSYQQMLDWLGGDFTYNPQVDGDLGDRMLAVFKQGRDAGFQNTVLIGTDCPGITAGILSQAFLALSEADLVLGPAVDGGYYCIGLSQPYAQLFDGIPWGSDQVLNETLAIARQLNLSIHLLPELHDIDRPEDLVHWDLIQQQKKSPAKISVIIPCLNEEAHIEKSIRSAQQQPDAEIIVVDGGSQDRTMEILRNLDGVSVVSHSTGRARQMNRGADLANGSALLFLHADTTLPKNYSSHILQVLNTPQISVGAFRLKVDLNDWRVRVMEHLVHWRSTLFQMPYGDQGIFVKTSNFQRVGGFPELPILEDYELVRKLREIGKVKIAESAVVTSGRRWQTLGIFQTTRINWSMIWKYRRGECPEALRKWYREAVHSSGERMTP